MHWLYKFVFQQQCHSRNCVELTVMCGCQDTCMRQLLSMLHLGFDSLFGTFQCMISALSNCLLPTRSVRCSPPDKVRGSREIITGSALIPIAVPFSCNLWTVRLQTVALARFLVSTVWTPSWFLKTIIRADSPSMWVSHGALVTYPMHMLAATTRDLLRI